MNKQELFNQIIQLKSEVGMWEIAINEHRESDFVIGYYYDDSEEKYNVYINNERGRQRIKKSTESEVEALAKVLSLVEFEAETNRRNARMR